MASVDTPVPVAEIESVLEWVDTFKLSRSFKKINRDFSDAVLLAEILGQHYPKLVEMHNYPPRNSQALKLNNWMTLNRKVLKKLKINLCSSTMELLSNSAAGVIERVLLMVRDKIRRDAELSRTETEQNMSSGGSYYEACDEDNVLLVPVKTRVNGVLEVTQRRVVAHQALLDAKQQLRDAREAADVARQKVEHLENLLKIKEERIEELQTQLERRTQRRRDSEALQHSRSVLELPVPSHYALQYEPSAKPSESNIPAQIYKTPSIASAEKPESCIPVSVQRVASARSVGGAKPESSPKLPDKESRSYIPVPEATRSLSHIHMSPKVSNERLSSKTPSISGESDASAAEARVDVVKSDVFKESLSDMHNITMRATLNKKDSKFDSELIRDTLNEVEVVDQLYEQISGEKLHFGDGVPGVAVIPAARIADAIQNEMQVISKEIEDVSS